MTSRNSREAVETAEGASAESGSPEPGSEPIAGDRGIPSINRVRSIQSRVTSVLAIALMSAVGLGLLTWYYANALSRPRAAQQSAQAAVRAKAQGEMALPSLGPIALPSVRAESAVPPSSTPADPPAVESLLGPAPPLPPSAAMDGTSSIASPAAQGAPTAGPPRLTPLERRLSGPAFARASKEEVSGPMGATASATDLRAYAASRESATSAATEPAAGLSTLLHPTVTPAVSASVLPTRRFLLAKGAFIDCTLETAIDSTLPGMTTCITATDTFSADGAVVLIERGTKLVGETRGQVSQGAARLFVLWTEARTPTGVVVPLSSPGTDELGRSGLPGEVNRHFWDRFGAAILLTVVNGAVQGAVASQNSGSSVIVSPSTSSDVMTEVLRGTVNIPPTLTKAQGDRIQVLVARDVDFRSVYALRMASAPVTPPAMP